MEISLNGVDFTSSDVQFLYLPGQQSETLRIFPTHGSSIGGTNVEVHGLSAISLINKSFRKFIVGITKCKFGNIIIDAHHINVDRDFITCRSPPAAVNRSTSKVTVDVSLTGFLTDFTSKGVTFFYGK